MIPSSTCSSSDPTESAPVNSIVMQPSDKDTGELETRRILREEEKQMIVNNYYIHDKESGWKQIPESEIPPNIPGTLVQPTPGEILPNNTAIENSIGETKADMSKKDTNNNKKLYLTAESNKNTHVVVEPKRYHSDKEQVQNMELPPVHNFNYPTPVRQTQTSETTAMLDCIHQLQLTLQQYVLMNSKQAEYHMSQNADLFAEMIKGQNRRDLDPAMMAIPKFTGKEPKKCLDWVNRIKNICDQSKHPV